MHFLFKLQCPYIALCGLILIGCSESTDQIPELILFPVSNSIDVNPDTRLSITFQTMPTIGDSGMVRVFDAITGKLVDSLDLGVPPGPTVRYEERAPYISAPYDYNQPHYTNQNMRPGTPSGGALPTPDSFQLSIIGGFSDGFHFYPAIAHDSEVIFQLHHNLLEYNKTYRVEIDPGVIIALDGSFTGIKGDYWTFSTRASPPSRDDKRLVVAADGSGDFNTVQGAIDFIPDHLPSRTVVFIKNGIYEEIVYFRNKSNVTFIGEHRDSVIVQYRNNEVFNPHPRNISTNEKPGTFPSRRAVFMGDNSSGIHLSGFTIRSLNEKPAQAEGLLLMGFENVIHNMTIEGSGDALQINGSVYLEDSSIKGFGDNVLGRGPAFFRRCELISTYGPHMWIRNTNANHGNVFVDCIFRTEGDVETVIARTSDNHGGGYPYAEAVLINCKLEGVRPQGWGVQGENTGNIHYWEYNSTRLSDGQPVDISQRHPISRQLVMPGDSILISNYSNPRYILDGWDPTIEH